MHSLPVTSEPATGRSPTLARCAIETLALTRLFGDTRALDALNLQIPGSCIFGLLGPNGAGKSTVIKTLTTLLPATSGTASVAGFDVAAQPVEVRKRIGYVPQMLSADGGLTATENLMLSACLYGLRGAERDTRIQEALRFAGLEPVAGHLVKTYSGGMIRSLEVAQATLHRPDVLFLDEPTIGLDPVALDVGIRWNVGAMLTVALAVFLGSCIFATFSLVIACTVKTRERFMGIGQVLTMPLFFASNAIYPLELMPTWLKAIALANPLTYLVDALRGAMINGGHSVYGLSSSFAIMAGVFVLFLLIAARLYPGLVR